MAGDAAGYQEFRKGWPVVLSAMLGIGLGLSPVPFYTIGSFAPELAREFGWSFGDIMGGLPFTTLAVIIVSPLVGLLSDRFGVRVVALVSVALFGLSFMSFALSTGSLTLYYLNWFLVAVLGAGTLPITWTRAVNNWFDLRKGLALGLCLLGTGLFGYLVKPFVAWVIADYGWRTAYVAIGALPLLIALPVGYIGFRDVGPARTTVAARKAGIAARYEATPGMTARDVFLSWRFWIIASSCLMIAFAVGGSIPNMEKILELNGFSRNDIPQITKLVGISVIVGRISGGWLIDRFWAPGVTFVMLAGPSWGCWTLASGTGGYLETATSVAMIGLAAGVEYDLMAFLVARYFGLKSYNLVYGVLYGFYATGAGVAPVVYGKFYDVTHSYGRPLVASTAIIVVSAFLMLLLGRYRRFERSGESAPAPLPLTASA